LQIKRTNIGQIQFPDNNIYNESIDFQSQIVLPKDTIYNSLEGMISELFLPDSFCKFFTLLRDLLSVIQLEINIPNHLDFMVSMIGSFSL